MQALILTQKYEKNALLFLRNGKTVLEHQIRLLMSCGIEHFVIQAQEEVAAIHAVCDKITGANIVLAEQAHDAKDAFLPSWMTAHLQEDVLVLSGDFLPSKAFVQDFIQKDHPFLMAVGAMQMEPDDTLRVKLDMSKAQYVATQMGGYGCFDMLPMWKISVETANLCLPLQQNAASYEDAFQRVVKETILQAFYTNDYEFVSISKEADRQALLDTIAKMCRKEVQKACGTDVMIQLPELLRNRNCKKLLVIHDDSYEALPVRHLLKDDFTVETCNILNVDPDKCNAWASQAWDAIVSVGGQEATTVAKKVKYCICKAQQAHNTIHTAVITRIEKQDLLSPTITVGADVIEHEMLVPEMVVCDYNVFTQDDQQDRVKNALELLVYNLDIALGYRADAHAMKSAVGSVTAIAKHILPYADSYMSRPAARSIFSRTMHSAELIDQKEAPIFSELAAPLMQACNCSDVEARLLCAIGLLPVVAKNISTEAKEQILGALAVKTVPQATAALSALYLKLCTVPSAKKKDILIGIPKKVVASNIRGMGIVLSEADISGVCTRIWDTLEELQARYQAEQAVKEEEPQEGQLRLDDISKWADLLIYAGKKTGSKKRRNLKSRIKHILYTRFSNQSVVRKFANYLQFVNRRVRYLFLRMKYPVNKKLIVFDSFNGKKYNCNPKGIYEALVRDPAYCDFTFVWAFKNPKPYMFLTENPNTRVVKMDSAAYRVFCAKAGYWIANAGMPAYLVPKKNQQYIHTWHGKPFKAIGCDVGFKTAGGRGAKENRKVYTAVSKKLTTLFSPSPIFTEKMTSAFNLNRLRKRHIVYESGYPRNDYLFRYDPQDVIKIKMSLGIPLDKKVVLYAPTWRPTVYEPGVGYIYHNPMDFTKLHEALGDDYIVIFRAHINEANSVDFSRYGNFLIDATQVEDVNDLYIISDLMISDYSGTIFDYANLKRPMVLYMYDKDSYMNDWTGTYFMPEDLPGEIVMTQEEMHESIIRQLEHFEYDEKYRQFNETFNGLDGADCAERVIADLINPAPQLTKKEERLDRFKQWLRNSQVKFNGFLRISGLQKKNENDLLLKSYRNKHAGERCFLIGNGPSLTMKDLEKVQNETTFSCNLVYKIFENTSWRPVYHCITDNIFSKTIADELVQKITVPLFMNHVAKDALKYKKHNRKTPEIISVQSIAQDPYYVKGNPLNYYVSSKATVMSFMIELAIYMGFKEIYLLGVDCSNGFVGKNTHFIEDYENEDMMRIEHKRAKNQMKGKHMTLEELGKYRTDRAMFAYSQLRKYADAHGVKVYNATRGGYLEEFERVNLDDLEFKTDEANGTDA